MSQEYSRPYVQQPQSPYKENTWKTWRQNTSFNPANRTTYFYHIGQSGFSVTGCSILVNIQSPVASGATAFADVAIWKGFFPLQLTSAFSYTGPFEEPPTLTRIGNANLGLVLGTTAGVKIVDCAFTAGNCVADDELWLGIGFSANNRPSLQANLPDWIQTGKYFTVTGLPRELTGAGPATLAWGSTTDYLIEYAVMLNA